jgi:hypothetical protein
LSIRYGLQVKVCNRLHKQIHANPLTGLDLELKKEYQAKFESEHGHDEFMRIFGRNYL